jgi:F0F1-type ATP synthase membrane subunit b/b'
MEIILAPESLRLKLGDEALKDLIQIINKSSQKTKEETIEVTSKMLENKNTETKTSIEKLIVETKAELQKQIIETQKKISEAETKILKWLFLFWVTQFAGMVGIKLLFR